MSNSSPFTLSLAGIVVGLVVMLLGVEQTSGMTLHPLTAVGGLIVLGAFGVLTMGIFQLEGGHAAE